jgi:phage replication initiation protein
MKKGVLEIMLKNSQNIDITRLAEDLKKSSAETTHINKVVSNDVVSDQISRVDYDVTLDNGYKLDYLSFTLLKDDYFNFNVMKALKYNIEDFTETTGRYFYNSALTLNNYVTIYYNDLTNTDKIYYESTANTVAIFFTGQGCTDLALKFNNDIYSVFKLLHSFNIKITRIDLAFDDFDGLLDFDLIEYKLNQGEYRSRKRSFSVHKGGAEKSEPTDYNVVKTGNVKQELLGRTIYLGNPRTTAKNVVYARFYDKYLQYKAKSQILPEKAEITGIWQRYELVFKRTKAHDLFLNYLFNEEFKNNVDKLYKSALRDMIEFLDVKEVGAVETHKRYWVISPWWDEFLQYNDKLKFSNHEKDADLGRLLKWLMTSVFPNLKVLEQIFENFGYDLFEILKNEPFLKSLSKKQFRIKNETNELEQEQFNKILKSYFRGNSPKEAENEDL